MRVHRDCVTVTVTLRMGHGHGHVSSNNLIRTGHVKVQTKGVAFLLYCCLIKGFWKQLFHQLVFVTPGISPWDANSRNFIRDILNSLSTPRPRPVSMHLFLILTFELFLGFSWSFLIKKDLLLWERLLFFIMDFRKARDPSSFLKRSLRFSSSCMGWTI